MRCVACMPLFFLKFPLVLCPEIINFVTLKTYKS